MSYSLQEVLGIVLFVGVAVLVFMLFDRPRRVARREHAAEPVGFVDPVGSGAATDLHARIDELVERYDAVVDAPPPPRQTPTDPFRRLAQRELQPLLDDVARTITARGHRAEVTQREEAGRLVLKLEVSPRDHPADQPAPYIELMPAAGGGVSVLQGGSTPGPADENGRRSEISWRDVSADEVSHEIRRFLETVFVRFSR
ncbi:hypothetical protein [Phenylobacterium sp.]|uniref:hypothetical protein n=1 Tax=Phenylobacterium sp. TaxID=1871053 RepID=UPI0035AE9736